MEANTSPVATPDHPHKCKRCHRYPHRFAAFPGGTCLPCHAEATKHDPLPTARELARMWGGR